MKKLLPIVIVIILVVGYFIANQKAKEGEKEIAEFRSSGGSESINLETSGNYDSLVIDGLVFKYPAHSLGENYNITDQYGNKETGGGYTLSSYRGGVVHISYSPLIDIADGHKVTDEEIKADLQSLAQGYAEKMKEEFHSNPVLREEQETMGQYLVNKYIIEDKSNKIFIYSFKSDNYYYSLASDKDEFLKSIILNLKK